jgi:hypothetical protein
LSLFGFHSGEELGRVHQGEVLKLLAESREVLWQLAVQPAEGVLDRPREGGMCAVPLITVRVGESCDVEGCRSLGQYAVEFCCVVRAMQKYS